MVRRMFADIEADVYIMVDGDDTYDAASVNRLIEPILYGQVDVVNSVRKATIKDAWLKRDTATIASIVGDDFQSWSFRGERRSKADMLRTVAKSDETDTVVEDSAVHIYGDTGIYTARLTDTGKHSDGRAFSTRSCLTAIFIRRDGRWQLVAEQQAIIPATPST